MRARSAITSLAAGILLAAISFAQDKPADKPKAGAPPKMDEKAAMEAMQKAATPGEAHKKLEPLVGTFEATVKSYMDPSKPPEESKGTSVNGWVLGNRFIEQKYDGTFMGQPFSGIGYTGYDNVTKRYVGTWMDTMSTGVMISKGTMTGKTMKASSSMSDPMTGKVTNMTTTFTIADDDHHKMEMWGPGPDGKNYKMMEIDYTRKK
jgi:hypothetical protein